MIPRGRPKLIYMDTIKRDIKKNGLTDVNILDRVDWRSAVSRAIHKSIQGEKTKKKQHFAGKYYDAYCGI